ncbi:protein tyrosine kinase [Necator americanus]|uniref:Protein tyrosine kinase n=1 Tax=Necator americanus TaxID=51031 RepID=W2TAM2_NECAM|nr:protein tyrosine kinase [Necator americanus]ETN78893.1 protein tyrosine kinase [Necator americanus]
MNYENGKPKRIFAIIEIIKQEEQKEKEQSQRGAGQEQQDSPYKQLDKALTTHLWYHGMIPRKEVEDMLKFGQKELFVGNSTKKKHKSDGEFGEVNLGRLKQKNGEEVDVAVKVMKGTKVKKAQLSAFFEEAKLMRRFDHPNIVRFFGVAPQEEPIMIVLEFACGGSLKSYCKTHSDIPAKKLLQFATDGARGMCYLAAHQVIHRDLAARNCLLGRRDELKISDFGLSIADKTEMKLDKLKSVPIKWLAPETLRQGIFSNKTDVWSYGVLLWEIFMQCGSDPFPGETNQKAKEHILNDPVPMYAPKGSPPVVQEVMAICFIKNPEQRADFVKILKILSPKEEPPAKPAEACQT